MRNPFNQSAIKAADIVDLLAQEQLLELSMDRSLQLKHNEMDLGNFWISVRHEYPQLFQQAIHILLPFVTTYLCESAFSSLTSIKNKQRYELKSVEHELRVCSSDIHPVSKQFVHVGNLILLVKYCCCYAFNVDVIWYLNLQSVLNA